MNRSLRPRSGFTLIELLITMGVILVLAVLLVVGFGYGIRQSRRSRALAELEQLMQDSLETRRQTGQWPAALPDRTPPDPWGRPYRYEAGETEIPGSEGMVVRRDDTLRIWSAGPDGQDGTPDDLQVRHP